MTFRLTRLELREVRIPFRFTFKHALAERKEANNLFVAIHSDTGHVGYGEVLPRPYLTGETIESAWNDISSRWWDAVKSLEFSDASPPTELLREVYLQADSERKTASYAGLDIAIHDLWGRVSATPGGALFDQQGRAETLTVALGGGGVKSVEWAARLGKLCGFRDFKLKVGRPDDEERLRAARALLGPRRDLRADANGAWTVEEALRETDALIRCGVSSVEQPVPAGDGDVEAMATIQSETGLAVMADESLCTRADAERLIEAKAARLWNVRLAKVGGFSGFIEMVRLADRAGSRVHLGVLVGESNLMQSAGRACSGLADFAHVEFGFPLVLLKMQPFRGDPSGYFGTGRPLHAAAGLGVEPNERVLKATTVRKVDLR